MQRLLKRLRPSYEEVRELALRETDPAQTSRFAPITRGPVFAILAVLVVLVLATPQLLLRLVLGPRGGDVEEA